MELRGHRRANKPQSGLFSRHSWLLQRLFSVYCRRIFLCVVATGRMTLFKNLQEFFVFIFFFVIIHLQICSFFLFSLQKSKTHVCSFGERAVPAEQPFQSSEKGGDSNFAVAASCWVSITHYFAEYFFFLP